MSSFSPEFVQYCRDQFPALARQENGKQVVFLDGPAGTQVPRQVIRAVADYMVNCNANHGGLFLSSVESDRLLQLARQAFADFLGTHDPGEIAFGQNMTSLTFAFSRALSRQWKPGDEIVVTRLDHDANIAPWVLAARDSGASVKWIELNRSDCTLDMDDLASKLTRRTKLVAVGAASNATGGINPIERICDMAHRVGAQVFVDAVHYGPHGRINVADWDCDYLTCSAYKFFGPHLGILWGRRDSMESLPAYKVRPASNELPDKWMTGTQSHEAIAGGLAAIDYLADLGRQLAGDPSLERPTALDECFQLITRYEQTLSAQLIEGLLQIPGIKIYGIDDLRRLGERFPTVSITHSGIPTPKLATWLAGEGINVWHGNYYALEFTESLNLEPDGMVRIGLVHYNTPAETERLLSALELCASTATATN